MANEITQVANTKRMKVRLVCKHDTEANWIKAINFIPEKGEVIIYDIDDNHSYERMKIGDGVTIVSSLPFVLDSVTIDTSNFAKLDAANTFTGTNTFNNDVTLKGSKITIEESGDVVNHVGYLDWNSIKLLDVNNGEGLTYTFPYESVSNDAGTIRTIASLEAANTFTGTNTFKKRIVIEPTAAPEECIEFKNANITWYGNWISGGSSDSHYNFLLPRSKTGNHTFAMLDDIVEFKESNPLGAGTYKCSLTREVTQWLNGSYGSYCTPGFLVAGYGDGSATSSTNAVAIGPDGFYKLTPSAAKIEYTLPDFTSATTTRIATLASDNNFTGKNIFRKSIKAESSSANAEYRADGITVQTISSDSMEQFSLGFPSESGTLAIAENIPNIEVNTGTGTTNLTSLTVGDTTYKVASLDASKFAGLSSDNTFTGSLNAFKGNVILQKLSGNNLTLIVDDGVDKATITSSSITFEEPASGQLCDYSIDGTITKRRLSTSETFSIKTPKKSGTIALTTDIPQNIQDSTGTSSLQQTPDSSKSGKLTFPEADLYAKILDSTLTLDSEVIGGQGNFSTSFGGNSSAQGKRSFAAGTTTVARGNYSAVFGDNSVTLATGTDSLAHGYQTVTAAPASHTEGAFTVVMNKKYTEGMFESSSSGGSSSGGGTGEPSTTPTDTLQMDSRRGEAGHADGFNSYVSGFAAHTDGVSNVADGHISKASGRSNRAWSYLSKVDGYQSVVKPDDTDTTATGEGSWANGKDIQIVGAKYAYAGGENGRVSKAANHSFSYGKGLTALAESQAVFGKYNSGDESSLFIVGYGDSDTDRKTAFRILDNGQVLSETAPTNDHAVVRLSELNTQIAKIDSNTTQIDSLWTTLRETNSNLVKVDGKFENYALKTAVPTLSGNNTFTGVTTFKSQPVIAQSNFLASNGTNLTDTASLNYKSISRNTNNKSYTLTIPEKNGTIAVTSDIRPTANPTEDSIVVWHSDGTCEWKAISSLTASTTSTNAANSVY